MALVEIFGHFGFGKRLLNGQTIKTISVYNAISKVVGKNQIKQTDTHGGIKSLLKLPFQIKRSLCNSENIIIMPAQRGIRIIAPLMHFFNKKKKKTIHYVVIGGWLPTLCSNKPKIRKYLKEFNYIYVETNSMKETLAGLGFKNIVVMPNFKEVKPLNESQLQSQFSEPYSLCTFSRVMIEKGIEDAVNTVIDINNKHGKIVYKLDIYGQVDLKQRKWFELLKRRFPSYIEYKGAISYDKSVEVLKMYYALLFPTYYEGEGFPGTLLDAMASGVPIIASDWKFNREIVNENNGVLFEPHNNKALAFAIESLNVSRKKCLNEYSKYLPDFAIKVLTDKLTIIHHGD